MKNVNSQVWINLISARDKVSKQFNNQLVNYTVNQASNIVWIQVSNIVCDQISNKVCDQVCDQVRNTQLSKTK